MSFNIIKSSEEIKLSRVAGLIYGFPGAGKTSTANTANTPITLDFDNGSHRSAFRGDVLRITRWEDIQSNMKEFTKAVEAYDTVIVDTVSTCLDYIGEFLSRNNPKIANNKLKFYGELKDTFNKFVQTLKANGKDLIFIAQVREKDENGVPMKRPDITGGSYDIVTSLCDFIGYQYYKDKIRELDFEPTEEYIGKNPMGFEKIALPNYSSETNFFAIKIQEIKDRLGNISQSQKEATDKVRAIISQIKSADTADKLNEIVSQIKTSEYSKSIMAQIREPFPAKMKELGVSLNKETGLYEPIEEDKDKVAKSEPVPPKAEKRTRPIPQEETADKAEEVPFF